MPSAARTALLNGLSAFRGALDQPAVLSSDPTGDFLRRGLTVASYNLFEAFIADRVAEVATHINGGHTQFLDLPETLQRRAITNTLNVANNQLRWASQELADLRTFSERLGKSLIAVNRTLGLSPLTWLWPGSNMSADNYKDALRAFHVNDPWDSIRDLAGRLGFAVVDYSGAPIRFKDDLVAFATERHRCAHVASHGITTLWLRTVPDRILRFSITFDGLVSTAAHELRVGNPSFLGNDKWVTPARIRIRFVRKRPHGFAEVIETRTRATSLHTDGNALFAAAAAHCGPGEVLVRQGAANEITEWAIPSVD